MMYVCPLGDKNDKEPASQLCLFAEDFSLLVVVWYMLYFYPYLVKWSIIYQWLKHVETTNYLALSSMLSLDPSKKRSFGVPTRCCSLFASDFGVTLICPRPTWSKIQPEICPRAKCFFCFFCIAKLGYQQRGRFGVIICCIPIFKCVSIILSFEPAASTRQILELLNNPIRLAQPEDLEDPIWPGTFSEWNGEMLGTKITTLSTFTNHHFRKLSVFTRIIPIASMYMVNIHRSMCYCNWLLSNLEVELGKLPKFKPWWHLKMKINQDTFKISDDMLVPSAAQQLPFFFLKWPTIAATVASHRHLDASHPPHH